MRLFLWNYIRWIEVLMTDLLPVQVFCFVSDLVIMVSSLSSLRASVGFPDLNVNNNNSYMNESVSQELCR